MTELRRVRIGDVGTDHDVTEHGLVSSSSSIIGNARTSVA